MNNIETLLEVELQDEFEALSGMEEGSDKYKVTVDGVTKLLDRAIEMRKLDLDHELRIQNLEAERKAKIEDRTAEDEWKVKQMREDRIDRAIKHGLTVVTFMGQIIIVCWGAKKAWKFEETGSITSTAGRKFMDGIFSFLRK